MGSTLGTGGAGARETAGAVRVWFWLSVAVAVLATGGSVVGLVFENAIYGRETPDWAAQSVGQDLANLIAFPALVIAAVLAVRGSLRAYLVWAGILAYSVYSYAIYVFAIHFGPLFLVWVAVLGLSIYALGGVISSVEPERVRRVFKASSAERFAARLVIAIGAVFSVTWLSEIVPAILSGTSPAALKKVDLVTNPVHVLDLAVLLPALVLGGAMLLKRRPWGYVLVPVLLVATISLAVGIVSLMLVSAARGLDAQPVVMTAVAVLAVIESIAVAGMLRHVHRDARTADLLRGQELRSAAPPPEAGRRRQGPPATALSA